MTEEKERQDLKVLTLIIKQKYFDAILQGRKVQEFREIRPTNEKKHILIDQEGYAQLDDEGNCIPIKYDAIRFYVGYQKDRDTALIEVLSAYTQILCDSKGHPITYDYNGEEYSAEQIVYNLGKVLEHNIREQSKQV